MRGCSTVPVIHPVHISPPARWLFFNPKSPFRPLSGASTHAIPPYAWLHILMVYSNREHGLADHLGNHQLCRVACPLARPVIISAPLPRRRAKPSTFPTGIRYDGLRELRVRCWEHARGEREDLQIKSAAGRHTPPSPSPGPRIWYCGSKIKRVGEAPVFCSSRSAAVTPSRPTRPGARTASHHGQARPQVPVVAPRPPGRRRQRRLHQLRSRLLQWRFLLH